jgi:hypothetical protein
MSIPPSDNITPPPRDIDTAATLRSARFWAVVHRVWLPVVFALLLASVVLGLSTSDRSFSVIRLILLTSSIVLFIVPVVASFRSLGPLNQADDLMHDATLQTDKQAATDMLDRAQSLIASTQGKSRWSTDAQFRMLSALLWLRHRQERHAEARSVAEHLIRYTSNRLPQTQQAAWFVLARSCLESGDLAPVPAAMHAMRNAADSLDVSLTVDAIETEYLFRIGQTRLLAQDVARRTDLAFLMLRHDMLPTLRFLARACDIEGQPDVARQLSRSAELLA